MFFSKKIILFFTRRKLEVIQVGAVKSLDKKQLYQVNWTVDTLPKLLLQMMTDLSVDTVRVLVADNLGYLVTLSIPNNTDNERELVATKVAEEIPEILENQDWDYHQIETKNDQKKIRAFALLQSFWQPLKKAVRESGMQIEALELVSIATERNKDPVMGLALKQDINGKDEETLNFTLKKSTQNPKKSGQVVPPESDDPSQSSQKDQDVPDQKQSLPKTQLYILLGLVIVLVIIVVIFLV